MKKIEKNIMKNIKYIAVFIAILFAIFYIYKDIYLYNSIRRISNIQYTYDIEVCLFKYAISTGRIVANKLDLLNSLTECNEWIKLDFENGDYLVDIDSSLLKIYVRKPFMSNLFKHEEISETDGYFILGPYRLLPENQLIVSKANHSTSEKEFKSKLDSLISEINLSFSASKPNYYFYEKSTRLNLIYDQKSDSYIHTLFPNDYLSEEFVVALKKSLHSFLKVNDVNFLQINILVPYFSPAPPPVIALPSQ